jgi:hypothetical protein
MDMQVVLDSDDTIAVIDNKGELLLGTRYSINEILKLLPGERLEVANQYLIYKPIGSGSIQVIFPVHGDWTTVEATVTDLHAAMFHSGC